MEHFYQIFWPQLHLNIKKDSLKLLSKKFRNNLKPSARNPNCWMSKKWNNPLWVDFDFFTTHLMRVFCLKRLSLPQREELLKSLSLSISGWEMNRGLRRTRKTLLSITTVGRQTFAEKIFGLSLLVANVWLRLSIEILFERFYENRTIDLIDWTTRTIQLA